MATTFLEPGGDATFDTKLWKGGTSGVTVVSDFVHGSHLRSLRYPPGGTRNVITDTAIQTLFDSGSRISVYIYIAVLPTASMKLFSARTSSNTTVFGVYITSGGVLQIWNADTAQIGNNGSTLSTGVWYRISVAYTITNTTTNEFRLFKNGSFDISITNATLTRTGTYSLWMGMVGAESDVNYDFRSSDHYIDTNSSLRDIGDIWVTAKRPFSNGTTNGFTTQIGVGGSGYGSGHSPQVNERALSTTNGWSMVGAGSAITEEYNIEGKGVGDININANTIVDYIGWAYMSSLAGETVQMIINGVNFPQAITSSNTMYIKVASSTVYPLGIGTDIGITTDTSLTTVSLFECGVVIAYIPSKGFKINYIRPRAFGPGLAR